MVETNKELLSNLEIKPNTLWERRIGPSQVTRKETILFSGKEREKIPLLYTVIKVSPEANFTINYDQELINLGIKLGTGGLLIDQEATKSFLGREAGKLPEFFIKDSQEETVAFCPSNFGWQKDAFLIVNGHLLLLNNDQKEMNGSFEAIGLKQKKWESVKIEFKDRKVVPSPDFNKLEYGFSLPLILKDEKIIPLEITIGDPRFLADLRNVIDFGVGEKLPNEFWFYLRNLLPNTGIAGKRLVEGGTVVVRRKGLLSEEANNLSEIIQNNQLEKWLRVDTRRGLPRLAVIEKLPLNRIPAIGIGFNRENQLIVVAADGRQDKSAGVTIEELACLMKKEGAITAGLGSAGGDVAMIVKTGKGFEILNSPSNRNHQTRLVPSVLAISPK